MTARRVVQRAANHPRLCRASGGRVTCRLLAAITFCVLNTGCQSTGDLSGTAPDRRGLRIAETAGEHFRQGDVDAAIADYRKALARAWALDDPDESATNAYNLAACLVGRGEFIEAKDWLLDARMEFQRAGAWSGNTWLLEATIARREARFDDARQYLQWAVCDEPPCAPEVGRSKAGGRMCGPEDPCRPTVVDKLPIAGPLKRSRRAQESCRVGYRAQIHFARARLAAEQYDLTTAREQLRIGRELITGQCNLDLVAEGHNVAAFIHLASGEYQQAGEQFDREAESLRRAGNHRIIPAALELAGAAYAEAGRPDLAASRFNRVARIFYGRGDLKTAWRHLRHAISLDEQHSKPGLRQRLALVAGQIQRALEQNLPTKTQNAKAPPEANARPTGSGPATQVDDHARDIRDGRFSIIPSDPIDLDLSASSGLDLAGMLLSTRQELPVSQTVLEPVRTRVPDSSLE